ncbi:hypothetical protein ZWY2020_048725 [Hordeum vulgare]|nr:hypothetical protein ZWY2020_048725 [Hordeum vulgare]
MERLVRRRVVHTVAVAAALLLLLQQPLDAAAANCSARCGGIGFSYPFGIEAGCYHDGFNLTCDHSYRPPKLFLGDGTVEVLEISIPTDTVCVNSSSIALSPTVGAPGKKANGAANNVQALLMEDNITVNACATYCPPAPGKGQPFQFPLNKECSGIGCCSAAIPKGYTSYSIQVQPPGNVSEFDSESSVYIAEEGSYNVTRLILETVNTLIVLLDWVINNSTCAKELPGTPASGCRSGSSSCQNYTSFAYKGYRCSCSAGYEGNPYVVDGCQDIDECAHWELHSCYGTCTNVPGAFRCQCPDETRESLHERGASRTRNPLKV